MPDPATVRVRGNGRAPVAGTWSARGVTDAKRNGSSYLYARACVRACTFVISSDRTRPDQYELLSLFGAEGNEQP